MPALSITQQRWLQLTRIPSLGVRTLFCLYQRCGSAHAIFSSEDADWQDLGMRPDMARALAKAPAIDTRYQENLESWLSLPDRHLITLECPAYPAILKEIYDPPPLLYIWGDPEVLQQAQIAIVGSRHASQQGLRSAHDFSRQLSNGGWVPSSGLALGIDTQAHEGALEGMGLTVAVLGTGLDQVYPKRNAELARRIVEAGGALVSEFALGTPAIGTNFPRRNRIISGLSMATLVVEAALNSGSLITARLASDQGREVFAIPGSIHNPLSKGCHTLIRKGAKLVETVDDIYEELAPQLTLELSAAATASARIEALPNTDNLPAAQQCLLAALREHQQIDELVAATGLSVSEVLSELLALEVEGLVQQVGGAYQALI